MRQVLPALVAVVCLTGCAAVGGGGAPSAPPDAAPASGSATSRPDPTPSADRSGPGSPEATASAPSTQEPASGSRTDRPAPVRLEVPAIGVAEDLIGLGITEAGSLEVPVDPGEVGWFTGGGRPGGRGPTVLVGHVDSETGPAVFYRLGELGAGDEISVGTGEDVVRYRVDEVGDVDKGAFPTEDVFGATASDELRLITCTGWDVEARTYQGNRIVWASAIA